MMRENKIVSEPRKDQQLYSHNGSVVGAAGKIHMGEEPIGIMEQRPSIHKVLISIGESFATSFVCI